MYVLCQHLKPVSGCIWSFSTGMKLCSGWKFGAFWLVQVNRKIIGRFSKEEVTIVIIDEGELKSESWLEKWQSGKLCTGSRVQSFSGAFAFWGFHWRRVVFSTVWNGVSFRESFGRRNFSNKWGDCTNKSQRKLRN